MGWMPGRSSVAVSEAWRRAAHKSYWATAWLRLSPALALPTPQPTSPQNKVSIHSIQCSDRYISSPSPSSSLVSLRVPPRARGAAELDRYKGSSSASARPSSTSRHQAAVGPGAAFVFWSPLHKHGARGAPMTTTSTHLDLEAARRGGGGGGGGGSSSPPGYEQAEVSSLRTTKPRPPSFLPSARFPSVSIRTRAFHDLSICWIPSPRSS